MKLYEFLKSYREENHLTQEDLAQQCQVSKTTIAKLENPENKKRPSMKVLRNLMANMPIQGDALWSIVRDDEIYSSMNFAEKWEKQQAEEYGALFRKLNWKGQGIALAQLRILAATDELRKK